MAKKIQLKKAGRPSEGLTVHVPIRVRMSPELKEAIDDKSDRMGITIAFVVRRALELWVCGEFDPSKPSK